MGIIRQALLGTAIMVSGALVAVPALEEDEAPAGMTRERMGELLARVDPEVKGEGGFWQLHVEGAPVTIVTDADADRMRILVPVIRVSELHDDELQRLMQANFDSALDARYAIAKELVWSAFIHPLSALNDREFLSGLGQTVNLAASFRQTYSSGALIFRGGDSGELQRRELIDQLIEKGLAI